MASTTSRPPSGEVKPATNRFSKWDSSAAIRSKPRQRLRERTAVGRDNLLYFSPDLVPLSRHRSITERDLGTQMLLQHLYNYLAFTAILEHRFVNPLMIHIAHGELGVSLPKSMIVDAYRIYCDEGYHGLCSADLTHQIEEFSGVEPLARTRLPRPFRELHESIAVAPQAMKPLLEMAFVTVSETLVSAILTKAHLDARVEPAIRQVILEHAQDEAVHQAYFSDFIKIAWPQLGIEERRFLGQRLPAMIIRFLGADLEHLGRILTSFGIPDDEAAAALAECHPEADALEAARRASGFTIGLFKSVGALDDEDTQRAFVRSGLITA